MSNINDAKDVTSSSTSIYSQDAGVKQGTLSNNGVDDVWLHFGDGPAVDNEGTKLARLGNEGDTLQLTSGMAKSALFGIVAVTTSAVAFTRITDV